MRLFVSGSAPLLAETHREFQARTGHAILERYGMTETNMNTSNPYDGDRVPGTVGFPLPGVDLRVADPETGRALADRRDRHDRGERPQRVQGLLAHAGEDGGGVPAGRLLHHRRPRQGRCARLRPHRRPRQGPHHHRRLQRLSQGGRGRDRRPARRRGERRHRRCRIPDFGEAVAAVVGPRRRARTSPRPRSRQGSQDRLARFKQPKRVFFVDDLPRNAMGKVQKNVLREQFAGAA